MKPTRIIRRSANFESLMLGIGTVLAGSASAAENGNLEVLPAILCLLFAVFVQMGANLSNAYFETNEYYKNLPKPLFGDARYVGNDMAARVVREGALACFLISVTIGLTLISFADSVWWMLLIAAIIYGIAILEDIGKRPFFRTPWSLLSTFFLFGPVGVIGVSLTQSQYDFGDTLNFYDISPSLFIGAGAGFLAVSSHLLMKYFNYKIQPGANKMNLTFLVGTRWMRFFIFLCGLLMVVCVAAGVWTLKFGDPVISMVPAILGFLLNTYLAVRIRANGLVGLQHLLTLSMVNFVLTFGLMLAIFLFTGSPDDSVSRIF